jgi:multidrug efflux pump subunit AcrA (membrane-fusion protein)
MATPLPSRTFAQAGKRRHRQSALAAVIVMSCSALPVRSSISFAKAQSASSAAERQPLPVKPSAKAESEDRSKPFASVVIPATIQAYFITDLYAKDSGYVSQVNNDIGDHVKQGQVLAVIEDPELQAQLDKAQAAVLQASADIEVAKRQLAAMQADLILQQFTLKRQKESSPARRQRPRRSMKRVPRKACRAPTWKPGKHGLNWPRPTSTPLTPKRKGFGPCSNTTKSWHPTTAS